MTNHTNHGGPRTNSSRSSNQSRRGRHKHIPKSGAVGFSFSERGAFTVSPKIDRRIRESQDIFDGKRVNKDNRKEMGLK